MDRPADDDRDAVAGRFVLLADHDFAGYCPLYERIARAAATDPDVLDVVAGVVPPNRTPVLGLAAVHHLALGDPEGELARRYRGELDGDPWPAFHAFVLDRAAEVRALMATHAIQTNEVGRSAALVAGLAAVAADQHRRGDRRPLHLLELGPSAGLNLLFDRYEVTYVDTSGAVVATTGPSGSPVQLRCELRGPDRPPLQERPTVAGREGVDVDPVDVLDPEACRWLSACVWPGVPDRPERLAAALTLARSDPPLLHRGDAVRDLPRLLEAVPPDRLPVVVATWALAYLDRPGRLEVAAVVDRAGADRDVALLTAEAPQVTPWVPAATDDQTALAGDTRGGGTVTALGLRHWTGGRRTSRLLALLHPHARWVAWLDGGEDR